MARDRPAGGPAAPAPLLGRCVVEICRVPFIGGAERIALNCAEVVRTGGGRAIVACPLGGQLEAAARMADLEVCEIHALSGRRGIASDVFRGLRATARNSQILKTLAAERQIDLIHAHHPIGAFQAAGAARGRPPLILHVHETLPVPRQYAALAGWLKKRCDGFICVSDAGRRMLRRLGMAEERIHLVYNAVGEAYFSRPSPAELGPGPHIGIFGVLEPRKGHADLIGAFGRLARTHPTAQLWIVGELSYAQNADYLETLKTIAARWDVLPRVHFTGYRSDIPSLMSAMDVVVLASREFESLPTVLLEVAALGRVSVATDVGGVREIVTHGQTGFVVRPGDEAELGKALASALSPAAEGFGAAARARALARFSQARFERDLSGLFGEFLRPPRRAGP